MFLKPAALDHAASTFTADDLNRTIAHYRRLNAAEKKVAALVEEAAAECAPEHGRLSAGTPPHSLAD